MAVTKIWTIKDSLQRVLDYAANPDKTEYDALAQTLHYAENDAKTKLNENAQLVTGIHCRADHAWEDMRAVQERFGKTDGVVALHAYQSFREGEVTPEQGIIFDLDGVICSTDEYHYQAWKQLANRIGVPFDRTVNNRLRGVSRMASLDIILEQSDKRFTDAEKQDMAEEKNRTYRKLLNNMTPADLSDKVRDTLEWLSAQGLRAVRAQ